ncbi:trihelix transcription factor ASR3-like isoform X1 [Vigna radiata var. radiata]|uniref:Trihelix transcription factor ASR3-like isoform X1 n=1 Tax=Vigna radiata var. radiata TaxID=3916 RepID=A0A3Q0F5I9_VIGRR|nr:trihelix transcription factor ASR3-like isoform X1 [Vigna radiata var. radiata]
MAEESAEKICEGVSESPTTTPVGGQTTRRIKATRHPRWTRQETLVLIESKKMVESGEQGCRFRSASGFVQSDPKWEMVSSFCQQRGVKRGAVQCRKRWGNLLTDFRKIKKWESGVKEESESFWIMRNDVRKEKKLPGFFDSVVYNVLDGGVCTTVAFPLTLVKMVPKVENGFAEVVGPEQCKENEEEEEEEEEDEAIVDSEKMSWSTEEENVETSVAANIANGVLKVPPGFKEKEITGSLRNTPLLSMPTQAEKQQQHQQPPSCQGNYDPCFQREPVFQHGYKRKRLSSDSSEDNTDFDNSITKLLRRNSEILKAHLGAQNINYELARNQQKQQTDILVAALGKLTDALTKIADKL